MEGKKLVPKRRFSEFKSKNEWNYYNWKEKVDISINMVDPKNDKFSNLPHIGPGNIESFTGLLLDNINTVKEDNLISGKFYFNAGDIIYGKINPQLGKYAYAPYEGLASADTYILNSKNGLNQRFLFMLLQTKKFFDYSVSVSKRSGMPKINRDELNEYTFCAPSTKEQQKIGEFFKVLDKRIANQVRKIAKVKALKSAYLTEMFPQEGETVPKRRFKGFEGEWKSVKIHEIAIRLDNLRIPITASKRIPGMTPYYGANGIQDYVKGHTHDGENVLIAEDGANDLKNYPVHYCVGEIWVNNHAHVLRGKDNILNNLFFSYLLKTINMTPYLVGGGRAKLNSDIMMGIDCIIPEIAEQQKIGEFFKNLDDQITTEEKKLVKLKKIKEAYLEEMFV